MGAYINNCGHFGGKDGVGAIFVLKKEITERRDFEAYMKFPPQWGYQYFLELCI